MTGKKIFHPLIRKGDFKKVFEHGSKFSSRYLVIYAQPNGLSFSRLGLSVSKKVGTAVVRNRTKRRLREAVRKQLMNNPLRYDLIIVARKAAAEAGFADLNRGVIKALSGLVNEDNSHNNNKTV